MKNLVSNYYFSRNRKTKLNNNKLLKKNYNNK